MRLWVVGTDVDDAPQPEMFEAQLTDAGIVGHCQLRDVEMRVLPAVVSQLEQGVVDGCIVTGAFRAAMVPHCGALTEDAERLGAVTLITLRDGVLHGDNTQALGIEFGLSAQRMWPLHDARVVILGAGHAAAAAALALSRVPAQIVISARRTAAAEALVALLGDTVDARAVPWDRESLSGHLASAQLLINCTPANAANLPVDVHWLPARGTVADMRFQPRPTDLVTVAEAAGLRASDGLSIYLQTQMLGFSRSTGIDPPWGAAEDVLMRRAAASTGRFLV